MSFARNANANNPFAYYVCGKHRAYRYKGGECTRHYLRYDVLYAYVLTRIQYWAVRPKELTAELLNTLIEKIIVHEATEDDFGFRQQEIEIIFRFVGKID